MPRISAVPALAFVLTACAQTGDFGRPQPNLFNDTIAPFTGTVAAQARKEPASFALLTDDEQQLRNRAYQFLMPARPRSEFDRQLSALTTNRVLPKDALGLDPAAYFQVLSARADRSPAARYQALREDMENDRLLLGPFVAVACRVKEADRIRLQAMDKLPDVADVVKLSAENRVAENTALVRWVYESVDLRVVAYRFALQNMVVETPDRDAIKVEREFTAFDADRLGLERCSSKSVTVEMAARPSTPRYTPRPEKPELPPK